MRIAQIAPLWECVPPQTYGGTELVVDILSRELTNLGHQVTIFGVANPDSPYDSIAVESNLAQPMRAMGLTHEQAIAYELELLEQVFSRADEFDVIHNHMGYQALHMATLSKTPVVTTLHGVFEPEEQKRHMELHADLPYVSISHFQRKPCPHLNYMATVYHGMYWDKFNADVDPTNKTYFAFLGRFSPEKGPHHAIDVAKTLKLPLIMAGKVDPKDEAYFESEIQPNIDGKLIRYIGEVNFEQKVELLRNAKATLCPVTWPEPFGLVLIESMGCGTPVIAFRDGSIPEVIASGKTGFIVDSVDAMIAAVLEIDSIRRADCRAHVERKFSARSMAEGYIDVYQRLAQVAPSARPSGRLLPTAASLLADEALFMASPKTMITSFPIDAVTLDDSDTEVLTA